MAEPKWGPFNDLFYMQEGVDMIFDGALSRARGQGGPYGMWMPPVDIYETDDEIVLKAELPGMKRDEFQVEVENNYISLFGERRYDKSLSEENYHRMERPYGLFKRVFTLPDIVDRDRVKASYNNGVLEITVPKAVHPMAHKVKIDVE